jgi:hypothetical protein
MTQYPIRDEGLYHLTKHGWVRKDHAPFPDDRLETWAYEMECLAQDAKERVCLRRTWKARHSDPQECQTLRGFFGTPVALTAERNIMLEADV